MKITVREEEERDYRRSEEIIREAFSYPGRIERGGIGCPYEHWMVHELRKRDGAGISLGAGAGGGPPARTGSAAPTTDRGPPFRKIKRPIARLRARTLPPSIDRLRDPLRGTEAPKQSHTTSSHTVSCVQRTRWYYHMKSGWNCQELSRLQPSAASATIGQNGKGGSPCPHTGRRSARTRPRSGTS